MVVAFQLKTPREPEIRIWWCQERVNFFVKFTHVVPCLLGKYSSSHNHGSGNGVLEDVFSLQMGYFPLP